jgi:hypothetical protein
MSTFDQELAEEINFDMWMANEEYWDGVNEGAEHDDPAAYGLGWDDLDDIDPDYYEDTANYLYN